MSRRDRRSSIELMAAYTMPLNPPSGPLLPTGSSRGRPHPAHCTPTRPPPPRDAVHAGLQTEVGGEERFQHGARGRVLAEHQVSTPGMDHELRSRDPVGGAPGGVVGGKGVVARVDDQRGNLDGFEWVVVDGRVRRVGVEHHTIGPVADGEDAVDDGGDRRAYLEREREVLRYATDEVHERRVGRDCGEPHEEIAAEEQIQDGRRWGRGGGAGQVGGHEQEMSHPIGMAQRQLQRRGDAG